ncbi:sulfotransferase family protein [Actinocorallia herbida]|uniref:Sulfotransferase family protein n=1 Tax=Actinocorallia herbida TaxID=58109 RepID=A0A3N1CW22_9ACTN|nr:sulfotransferase [Actinocorallia herbida]ROO85454.1 sulfotransferase family protein [Actinocorallia herbida]
MTWRPSPRSPQVQGIYAAAEADRAARPEKYTLDPDNAVVRALRGSDPDELGDPALWREGLENYLTSARNDGRLNALGVQMVGATAVGQLRARRAMARLPRADEPLPTPPIVIVGGWRTGTTFLFRLLAADPRLRAPLSAELGAPWRFAGADDARRERLIEESAAASAFLDTLNPDLATVHDFGARLPEECVVGMGRSFRNWGFSSTVRLDSYSTWLADQDLSGTYAAHRHALATLDRGDGRRWLLKAPAHTPELARLAEAFPGACVVFLHRDIVETVTSGASLFSVFRATYSDEVDPADVARFQTDQTELWLRRAHAFRASPAASSITLLDLAYRDLVSATEPVLRRIYDAASLPPPDDLRAMITAYHAAHPRTAKGTHRYAPADFSLTEETLRPRFAPLLPAPPT